jgi:hypothetical protein
MQKVANTSVAASQPRVSVMRHESDEPGGPSPPVRCVLSSSR